MESTVEQETTPQEPVSDGQWYASQAAADLLGIHRSTLHLAVRRMKLVPDAYTPGGHARFRRETLARFSERLALDSATGGDSSISRAVASAVGALSRFTALEPVCVAVVDAALTISPGFEACLVSLYDEDQQRGEFRVLASRGVSQRLMTHYYWLRRQPSVDFISLNAVRRGERFICEDVEAPSAQTPEGSQHTLREAGWRSCATFPCVSEGQGLGLLMCLGHSPYSVSEPEIVALGNLSDVVTVALRRWLRDEAARRQTETISAMMRQAQEAGARMPRADDLVTLRRICQQGAKARIVSEWGITSVAQSEAPPSLISLMRTAAIADTPQRAEWVDDDGRVVALAAPAPTACRQAAVGAIWRRQDMRSGMELALLEVYAQACAAIVRR